MNWKSTMVLLACAAGMLRAQNAVDLFDTAKLKGLTAKLAAEAKTKGEGFAGITLTKYGNHLTMLAHRESTGSSELHKKDADIFVIVEGDASIVTGGTIVGAKETEANEIRGKSIKGGQTQKLNHGDIIHIQANTPHQLLIAPGHTVTYFVVKVTQ